MNYLPIKLLNPSAKHPTRSTKGSVGYDICACIPEPITVCPGETRLIGSGVAIALEQGYAAFLFARSGLGVKHGIVPANGVGVIDSDYRGEIMIGIKNTSNLDYVICPGDRIAQIVIIRCELPELIAVDALDGTERGSHGFGSSNEKF